MATIRKRNHKNGDYSYIVQVKFKDKGSGKQILRTATWKPEAAMTPKQEERAITVFADNFEKQIKDTVSGGRSTTENPNITFREFAAKWLEKTKRDCSLSYYVSTGEIISEVNDYIGGYRLRDISPAVIQNLYDGLDKRQKTISRIIPKPEFRQVLESYGFKYMNLRYEYHVQACSLANAFAGKPVSKGWSSGLAEKINVPFDKLFDEKIMVEPYAYETIHKYKRTIRAILSLAKKNRLVSDNYASADYIDFPKRPSHSIEVMDDEEAKLFYKSVLEYPDIRYKTAMLLFLLTGFRRGEVAGLEWKDINFDEKTITVSRSLTTVSGYGSILKEPKTEGSKRTITIADTLVNALKEYREWQINRRKELGDYMEENDYLFTQENGERLNPSSYTGWLNKMLQVAGLDHHSLHSLRHTNITMQIAAGVPLVTVSARAGHARTSTTSDIYAHFIRSSDRSAAEIIDKVFNDPFEQKTNDETTDEVETVIQEKKEEINQIAETPPKEQPSSLAEETIMEISSQEQIQEVSDTDDSEFAELEKFRMMKAEMKRLGFDTYEEYEEYLDFVEYQKQKKLQKNKDFEM